MTGAATHQSLRRAVAILREFSEANPTLTVGEIARRLDLHKSTVSRILATLAEEGVVWQNPADGRYSLGLGLVEMAGVALGRIDVRAAALPHMDRLAEQVGETITVCVRRGQDAVTVAQVSSTRSVRQVAWIGRRFPLQTTASGRVFLGAAIAVEVDEFEVGSSSIAAPITDTGGAVVAALAIGAPTERFGPSERAQATPFLVETARAIAWDLGARAEASA